jgi:hypothetical protein
MSQIGYIQVLENLINVPPTASNTVIIVAMVIAAVFATANGHLQQHRGYHHESLRPCLQQYHSQL